MIYCSFLTVMRKTNLFIYKKSKYCVYDLFKMTSYTLGQKFIAPTKPERGVFPLDHEGRLVNYFFSHQLGIV
jgi:hypothetical protein